MIKVEGIEYLKIGEVRKILGKSAQTIKIWYEYAETDDTVILPPYRTDLDESGARYWDRKDVKLLVEFRDNIKKGMMSEVTSQKWGKRGKTVKHYGLNRFEEKEV